MNVHSSGSVTRRVPAGLVQGAVQAPLQALAQTLAQGLVRGFALAAALAFLVSGCSPDLGFPLIHDMPPPRAETPLTPDQVKQATDDLISERDHLSTGAQADAQAAVKKVSLPVPVPATPPATAQPPASGATQTAGADGKP